MNCIDDIRLEQFRQLKQEIRGSEKYLIIGIDTAKEKHNAFFGTALGKTLVKNLVFDNSLEGFQKLLAYVERIKVQYSLTAVVFGIEPTARLSQTPGGASDQVRVHGRSCGRCRGQEQPATSGRPLGQA